MLMLFIYSQINSLTSTSDKYHRYRIYSIFSLFKALSNDYWSVLMLILLQEYLVKTFQLHRPRKIQSYQSKLKINVLYLFKVSSVASWFRSLWCFHCQFEVVSRNFYCIFLSTQSMCRSPVSINKYLFKVNNKTLDERLWAVL